MSASFDGHVQTPNAARHCRHASHTRVPLFVILSLSLSFPPFTIDCSRIDP